MNHLHKKRLAYVSFFIIGLAIAATLILYALKQNLNVFVTPSQLTSKSFPPDYHFRLGGLVKSGSLIHDKNTLKVEFIVTDLKHDTKVQYTGVLPDLFREGKGVIAEGQLNSQQFFIASQILAKHDENYMPKNVYKALREETRDTTIR